MSTPEITPKIIARRKAQLDHIVNSLPKDMSTNEALNGLLSAFLTVGLRTCSTPYLIAALKACLRSLEIGYAPGSSVTLSSPTHQEVVSAELDIGAALMAKFEAAVPTGTPHNLELIALLARFSIVAEANVCCTSLSAEMAQQTADQLQSRATAAPSHLTH